MQVDYYEHLGGAEIKFWWERLTPLPIPDWMGEYWANPSLSGKPSLIRNDWAVDFNWGLRARRRPVCPAIISPPAGRDR